MCDANSVYIHYSTSPAEGKQGKKPKKHAKFREKTQAFKHGKHSFKHRNRHWQSTPPRHNGAPAQRPSAPAASQQTSNPSSRGPGPGGPTLSQRPSASTHTSSSSGGTENCVRPQTPASSSQSHASGHSSAGPLKYLAVDCEMVGTGPKGHISHLARCSVVSYEGDVIYDKFIKPPVPVTDYRTRWSGVRAKDLAKATPYPQARKEILKLLMGKVVVGHAIHNDFKVLGYGHPAALTRDTSRIPLLNLKAGFAPHECASLKRLTKAIFNRDIQTGKKGHSSVEDAKATMELYKVVEVEWERKLASGASVATYSQGHTTE